MKILLTGATGFIGKALVSELINYARDLLDWHPITTIDRQLKKIVEDEKII